MKIRLPSVAACMVAAAVAGPAFAVDYPARKPGLWEIQTGDATGKRPGHSSQQCIDAASDKTLREMGQGMGKDMCSKQDLRLEGGKLVVDSVCQIGTTTVTSHAVVSGDFSSAYRMESKSSYSPPLMGRAEGTSVMEAKWLGPCKADQKPGDMVMSNGMKMNMLEMMAGRGKK